ncbi:hypothetical protein GOP47_0000742 [Adiantum capillus-veneris]|uniref:protein-disulfide reductase n=1 Tax=Adiantum capillus-veneris TaxID=13818 RepID=A0A9D4VFJ5_ADICA|nr:hypothetical protein GOP47_0000742 [Adiantum capillus-veneris]
MASEGVLSKLLFAGSRDFLLNNEGAPVKADVVSGKVVGTIICPHWLPATLENIISLIKHSFEELKDRSLAFVFVAVDRDEELIDTMKQYGEASKLDERPDAECFADVLKRLPDGCFAIPLEDWETRKNIEQKYNTFISTLAFFGPDGRLLSDQGTALLEQWGAAGYPFDNDHIAELRKARYANQNLQALLVHKESDDLISSEDGKKVKVADLEGKIVALYFGAQWNIACKQYTPVLASVYKELKEKVEDFELVYISSDRSQELFTEYFSKMPWLAVPYENEKTRKHLNDWFEVKGFPTVVILDKQGRTLNTQGTELLYDYGVEAYPFTVERIEELKQAEEAKRAAQTLETLLVTEERDFVISKDNLVKVTSLVGKTVGLYFSAHWCPPCEKFTPKLISAYNELKARNTEFEVVFLSGDRDEESFNEYHRSMPWLAFPFNDKAISSLSEYFDIETIPQLVIIGPDGKTVRGDGRRCIEMYGVDAFPFTEDRVVEAKAAVDWKYCHFPKEVMSEKHEHTLTLTDKAYRVDTYTCDDCEEQGFRWVYHCAECDYAVHPECIGEATIEAKENGNQLEEDRTEPGYICERDVCRKM